MSVSPGTDLWRRAREVFDAVVDLEGDDRATQLAERCGSDTDLRRAVVGLLAADERREHMPDRAPIDDFEEMLQPESSSGERWLGRQMGPYEITEAIGRGGMGSVFLAERRDDAFEKQVAIKLVRVDLTGADGLARFRTERQLLARLEHPNVARLLDGGTTEEGIPYLVMEFVPGDPIVDFCDGRKLSIDDRLRLFRQVCDAVQYAHQNLVVHRDLKASNILVTADGIPKLLDFGIAKLVDESGVGVGQTETLSRRMTPDYASPEQILGGSITTVSDVYSLGVLLFELLVGARPHQLRGIALTELARRVEREPAPRPSEVARGVDASSAADRELTPERLRRRLAGDLDNIVSRALEKDPKRRYGSAEQIADELQRHLDGLPVQARPATLSYRMLRFCRRHRVAVLATTVGLGLLLTALFVSLEQRDTARRESARAEQVTEFLLRAFSEVDPDRARGREVSVREVLDDGALRLERDLVGEPELLAAMKIAIGTVYRNLGLYDEAEPLLADAIELRQRTHAADDPQLAEALHAHAQLLLDVGEFERAEVAVRRARAIRADARLAEAAESLHLLARARWNQDARGEAIELHREALAWTAATDGLGSAHYIDGLNLLGVALRSRGFYDEAHEVFEEALARQRQRVAGDHPTRAEILSEMANLAEARGELERARPLALEALAMYGRLYGESHPSIVATLSTLGNIEQLAGKPDEAVGYYLRGIEMQRRILGDQHPRLPSVLYNLASLLHRDLGRLSDAEPLYSEAVGTARAVLGDTHTNLGFFLIGYGDLLSDRGRSDEALVPLREAVALFDGKASERNRALAYNALGGAYLAQGRTAEARPLIVDSHPTIVDNLGEDHRAARRSLARLEALGGS